MPVFWMAGRVFRQRLGDDALRTTVAMTLAYLLIDVTVVVALAEDKTYNGLMSVPNGLTKFVAAWLGVRAARRP
jgi:hypothetical protein